MADSQPPPASAGPASATMPRLPSAGTPIGAPGGEGGRGMSSLAKDPSPTASPAKRPRLVLSPGRPSGGSQGPSGLTPSTEQLDLSAPASLNTAPGTAPRQAIPAGAASGPASQQVTPAGAGAGAATAMREAPAELKLVLLASEDLPERRDTHRPSPLQLPSPRVTPTSTPVQGANTAGGFLVPEARPPVVPSTPRLQTPGSFRPEHKRLVECVEGGDLAGASRLLEAENPQTRESWVNSIPSFTMLMQAAALRTASEEVRVGLTRLLITNGAHVNEVDSDGYSALHWSAAVGTADVMELLVTEGGASPNARSSSNGETPLHRASRLGAGACVKELLRLGADVSVRNYQYLTPLDVAGQYDGRTLTKQRTLVRKLILQLHESQRTAVFYHGDCLGHATPIYHQESPARLTAIMAKLRNVRIFEKHELHEINDFAPAHSAALNRAHTREYLAFLDGLGQQVLESDESVPFTPQVQKSISMFKGEEPKQKDRSDTQFTPGSLAAAKRAAGAVVAAIDAVMAGSYRNAFCCVRPPGHHAGPAGLVDDAVSCGFCLYNNVAVGALHALHERGDCHRVAIIDFDVHHGNGTQEIVDCVARQAHAEAGGASGLRDQLFFFSIHLYDTHRNCRIGDLSEELHSPSSSARGATGTDGAANALRRRPEAAGGADEWEFYPGTGGEDDVTNMVINAPLVPLWKQQQQQPFPGGGTAAPPARSTRKKSPKASTSASTVMPPPPDVGGSDHAASSSSSSSSATTPSTPSMAAAAVAGARGRNGFRGEVRRRLMPALRAFNPDLILLSAGFDGANKDQGNVKLSDDEYPKGLDLRGEDFTWLTEQVVASANICCNGRIVSVLEGGYGELQFKEKEWRYEREPLALNVVAHVRGLTGKRK